MIKIENIDVYGFEAAIRGARNPMNSWHLMDSCYNNGEFEIGEKDYDLLRRLTIAGPEHRKWNRMVTVTMDITAPMYWFSEYDTYKVGTVANSTSKMHRLLHKPFELSDFSFDHLIGKNNVTYNQINLSPMDTAKLIVDHLNELRDEYLKCDNETDKKQIWYNILQLLPNSYNQKRTVHLNYEVLGTMYKQRRHHKLSEWQVFCDTIKTLPYSEFITREFE